jgi:peptidoglycan biosynthesis protein MviN/MurJ (putative lipid II flippase)
MRRSPPADTSEAAPQLLPGPFSIWSLAFAYAGFMALLLQKLILPITPELHAGHGLMSNDAIAFHEIAAAMAQRIQMIGWSEWRLFPADGITGNVGLLAALYAVLGPDPVWFIPINAAYHALGALMIFLIGAVLSPGIAGRLGGLAAALLFLAFPSSLVWYGQNHKDAFMIAGILIALAGFLRVLDQGGRKNLLICALLMLFGLVQVAVMRPYMLTVFAAAFLCAWLGIFGYAVYSRSAEDPSALARLALMVVISIAVAGIAPSGHLVASEGLGAGGIQLENWRWVNSTSIPPAVDHVLERVSAVRAHVIQSGRKVGAGSIVDGDIAPENAGELVAYLPRALVVGLFSPFPDTWSERPTLPRVIGAVETLLWYLLAPGVVCLLVLRPSRQIFACLIFAAAVLTVLGYVSPNVGTLHRIRYAPLFLFSLAGAVGWVHLVAGFVRSLPAAQSAAVGSDAAMASLEAGLPGRGAAVGASVTVFLITAVGYIGLLARDLLLMNTYGFGAQLDSLFAALLLPMFFVSVFSLPLGDALVTGIQRLAGGPGDRLPLVRGAMSFLLLLCAAICLVLFVFADSIFASLLTVAEGENAVRLLRLALPLLLFSGLAVAGNSVLNSLNLPTTAAAAQLLVPVFAIAAILVADASSALYAAVIGMILGQLANIVVVFFFAYHKGYFLRPGAIRRNSSFKAMAGNYGWLVLAALVINVANPINYWFAGKLAIGSVSTWAMGSKLIQLVSGLTAAIMASVVTPYLASLVSGGQRHRLRGDVFSMLVVGTWICILGALIVLGFSEPFVIAAFSGGAVDPQQGLRLAYVLKLGALQIPFVFSTLLLIKLAAVSQDSSKVVIVALTGLAINVALNAALIADFGVVGMAVAWAGSVGASTLVLLLMTRSQTGLSYGQILVVLGSWGVLGGFAMALHLHSVATAVSAAIFLLFVLFGQWRAHRSPSA